MWYNIFWNSGMSRDDGRRLFSHMNFLRKRLAAIHEFEIGWNTVRAKGVGIQITAADVLLHVAAAICCYKHCAVHETRPEVSFAAGRSGSFAPPEVADVLGSALSSAQPAGPVVFCT